MMEANTSTRKLDVDLRWIGVGVCFFIVMHLLPTYLLYELRVITTMFSTFFSIWAFGGMAFVGFFIGWMSKGVTIIEAGLASLIYAFILMGAINYELGGPMVFPMVIKPWIWVIAVLVIATASAWLGEMVQAMQERGGE